MLDVTMLEVTMLDDLEAEGVDVMVGVDVIVGVVFSEVDEVVSTELELEVVTGTLVELAEDEWVKV